jgi:phosphohistidine phosphatase SixA
MIDPPRRAVLAGALALPALLALPRAPGAETAWPLEGAALFAALAKGGHVVFFRHAETGPDYPDAREAVLADCATQRNLNEVGKRQSAAIGAAFKARGIPVGDVLASEFCRCWQMADLAFGRHTKVPALTLPASAPRYTAADKAKARAEVAPLLAKAPPAGLNTVIIAHEGTLLMIGGPHLTVQGEAAIYRPAGPAPEHGRVARLFPDAWSA